MKRAIRWIGIAITAAAAATMLLADMVLAAPVTAVTLRFDLFSPPGTKCQAVGQAPATAPDRGRDLLGRPRLTGLPVGQAVLCTAADGRSFGVDTLGDPRDPLALGVEMIVVDRPGRAVPMLMVQADGQVEPLPVQNNAAALPAPRAVAR